MFELRETLVDAGPQAELCFDLENRPLAYWYDGNTTSEVTVFAWQWTEGGSPTSEMRSLVLLSDGYFERHDGIRLQKEAAYDYFLDELEGADLVYGHNIRTHDLPMLQAACIRLNFGRMDPCLTQDTYRDLPRRKELPVSLNNLSAMYGIGDKKMMAQHDWEEANRLGSAGIAEARERCESDVTLQIELYNILRDQGLLKKPKVWRP